MIYLYETVLGYNLLNKHNEDIKIIETYTFVDNDESYESYKLLEKKEMPENLLTFLQKAFENKNEVLHVRDKNLCELIQEKCDISTKHECISQFREIQNEICKYNSKNDNAMIRNLSYKIAVDKIKFSGDKLDAMIVQSSNLLIDMDKDINLHCMRIREWYGFHFPELSILIDDNEKYIKIVAVCGNKSCINKEMLDGVAKDKSDEIITLSENSMGTEMAAEDIENIVKDCESIQKNFEYRNALVKYIKDKMCTIAPNVTNLVGDNMGARLISKAGSLCNLAKFPGSTIQLLGAEKSLFQALKNKSNTPKYGIIFESSLIGQVSAELKGKLARSLASKIAMCAKIDYLSQNATGDFGANAKDKIMTRIKNLENSIKPKKKVITKTKFKLNVGDKYDDSRDVKRLKQQ